MRRCGDEWIRRGRQCLYSYRSFRSHQRAGLSWDGHGTDLLSDSLAHNSGVPKVILHGHSPTGFDVLSIIKNMDPSDQDLQKSGGIVHLNGSIMAFPGACFLWNVRSLEDLTIESLAPAQMYRPKLEYLFLGSAENIHPSLVQNLRRGLAAESSGLVIETMDLANAMGTFNILNGEDRMVAAALILPDDKNVDKF